MLQLKPTSIEKETFPAMVADNQLHAMTLEGFWMDVGQPRDFLAGMYLYLNSLAMKNADCLSKKDGIVGNVLIADGAKIGEDCKIGPNVTIGPNVVIGDGVRLRNCVIMDGAHIRDFAWIERSIIGWRSTVGRWVSEFSPCYILFGSFCKSTNQKKQPVDIYDPSKNYTTIGAHGECKCSR